MFAVFIIIMAIKDRKERDKLDRRKLILESATRLFLKHGYEKASIRNIAEDIEYSPATIYLYFKDKDEIFFILHEQGFDILNQEFLKHETVADPFDRLKAIGERYLQFSIDHPDYYDLMFIMKAPLNEISCMDKWDAGDNAFQFLMKTVAQCIDQNSIKHTDPGLVAMTVWSFVHGLASLCIKDRFKSMQMGDDKSINAMLFQSLAYFMESMKA